MFNKLFLLVGLVLVFVASMLVLREEPTMAAVRQAEALWQAGQISEALQRFTALERQNAPPFVQVRLAEISLLRGECDKAQRYVAAAFRSVTSRPLRRDEAALAHLVAGQCAARAGDVRYAEAEWSAVDLRSPLRTVSNVLRGEHALQEGRGQEAAKQYAAALRGPVVEPVRSFAHLRLALLRAGDEPVAAQQHLDQIQDVDPPSADLRPFLELSAAQISMRARQLEAILLQDPLARAQLLGQQLLELELYHIAVERFESVPATAATAPLARGYAALARWRAGQQDAALMQLRELHAYAPQQPFVATLYATILVDQNALDEADAVLNAAEAAQPLDPAIILVRSDVLAARRNYAAAVAERRRAFDLAPPEARPRYALAIAELHLSLTYQPCEAGVAAAQTATSLTPKDANAWQMLAALLYHCRQHTAAANAARRGLEADPDSAAFEFFLGAALWDSGQRRAGREHLRRAADLAPSSEWRKRAEALLTSAAVSTKSNVCSKHVSVVVAGTTVNVGCYIAA